MLKHVFVFAFVLLLVIGMTGCATTCGPSHCTACAKCPMKKAGCLMEGKTLRHVVLFKFKDGTSEEQVKSIVRAFQALPQHIDVVRTFEWGTDISPEKLSQGYTHCFLLTFSSEADRDAYLVHPEHKAFGKLLGPYLDKVCVVDFWSQN